MSKFPQNFHKFNLFIIVLTTQIVDDYYLEIQSKQKLAENIYSKTNYGAKSLTLIRFGLNFNIILTFSVNSDQEM